jgi:membrane protein
MDQDDGGDSWRSHLGAPGEQPRLSTDLARARESGRGREAVSPQDIPPRGWKDILWRVFWSVSEDRIISTSGGVAFFALLAIFPGIATAVSLYGLFADARVIGAHLSILAGLLPPGVIELIGTQVAAVASQDNRTLGRAFIAGTAVALWSANSGVAALFDALNVVYDEKEKRSIIGFYATTFVFTLGGIGFAVVAIAGVVILPVILNFLGSATTAEQLIGVLRWPILLITVIFALAALYRSGPSRHDAEWRWVTWGSVLAAILWVGASMLFSWYVASFDSYNKTYGSLGAGVGFMMWIWLSVVIVLLGGELNAEMEHQTARDTTEGAPKPLGRRGAVMADHVGAAQD